MRVALVALHYAEYALCLAEAVAADHDVLLILEKGNAEAELGPQPHLEHPRAQVRYVSHRADPAAALAQSAELYRMLRRFRPDVVHAQEVIYDSWAPLGTLLAHWPLVLTVHDPTPHSGETDMKGIRRRYPLYRALQRRRCDMAITHGDALAAELEQQLPAPAGRAVSIAHGVLGVLPGDAPPPAYSPDGSLLFLGRMVEYKGLPVFLDAVERLRERGITAPAVLAGRGPALGAAAAGAVFSSSCRWVVARARAARPDPGRGAGLRLDRLRFLGLGLSRARLAGGPAGCAGGAGL